MSRTPESILENLSGPNGFNADERETSILIDHNAGTVYFETTHPATARRWYRLFADVEEVTFETHRDSFGMRVPIECCRKPELILLPKYRPAIREGAVSDPETHDLGRSRINTHPAEIGA